MSEVLVDSIDFLILVFTKQISRCGSAGLLTEGSGVGESTSNIIQVDSRI